MLHSSMVKILSFCLFDFFLFFFVITVVDLLMIRLAFGHSTLIHDFVTSIPYSSSCASLSFQQVEPFFPNLRAYHFIII